MLEYLREWWDAKRRAWKAEGLAHPAQILRRLVMIPFVYVARALLVLVVLIGWGVDMARDIWNRTN